VMILNATFMLSWFVTQVAIAGASFREVRRGTLKTPSGYGAGPSLMGSGRFLDSRIDNGARGRGGTGRGRDGI